MFLFTKSAFKYRDGQVYLAKCSEPLPIRWSRLLPAGADPFTITVKRNKTLVIEFKTATGIEQKTILPGQVAIVQSGEPVPEVKPKAKPQCKELLRQAYEYWQSGDAWAAEFVEQVESAIR